jgi:hypothetical protein
MNFWELLHAFFVEKYGKYKIITIRHQTQGEGHITHLMCIPCKATKRIIYTPPAGLDFDGKIYSIADPDFTFGPVFDGVIFNHLWHHALGPLYTEKWKAGNIQW